MSTHRLPAGGLIDRAAPLAFTFDGKSMRGFAGDTLASALLANGRQLVGRSFKYHRPRGILTAGASEPNALVTVGRGGRSEPNTRATTQMLYAGLEASSQNRWPSLEFDLGAVNGLLSPFLGAGFYYKTFMRPSWFWEMVYEPLIRTAAGLGKASGEADPDRFEKTWAHCDLLVIGGGPTGIAAALTAARSGARVVLVDEQAMIGGSLLSETATIGDVSAPEFVRQAVGELNSFPNARVLASTTVFGWFDGNVFGAVERVQRGDSVADAGRLAERLWRIVAKKALLASGSEERPLVFGGNDIPGVMMATAMRTYLNRFAIAPGTRTAIFTTNDSGYALARDLEARGQPVVAVIDSRNDANPPYFGEFRVIRGAVVSDARGGKMLSSVDIWHGNRRENLKVDALAMAGGFSPIIHLACHRGGKPDWSDQYAAFLAPELSGLVVAGSCNAISGIAACLDDGAAKAASLVGDLGFRVEQQDFGTIEDDIVAPPARALWSIPRIRGKAFVDFQNDVHHRDLGLAVQEGYGHVEHAKRYTTNGMATDQGKLSNVNAIGLLADARGVSPREVGTTTFRPFYTPVSFGSLAGSYHGEHFQPVRKSPLHDWAAKHGAVFVESGLWYRSAWFPRDYETTWRESVDREATNVRANAGLCDVSMLGKIEVLGTDAAEFLDRVYSNGLRKLPIGKARYGLMLREDGMIYDDGTVSRFSEDHFFITTTTAYAAGVLNHLEFCAQVLWPNLDVHLSSSTDHWAQMAVAGPQSRNILQQIVDEDLSNAAFPFLGAREISLFQGQLHGRLFRISFSGELAYELAVPAGYGESVADALMIAGQNHGLQPYGVEALSVLRIEKGHVTHSEINGTVVPADLGFAKMVSPSKADFIGKHMLAREGLRDPERPQLVGIVPLDHQAAIRSGAHILEKNASWTLENDQGYVTSTAFSPHVGSKIGLALVKRWAARHGEEVIAYDSLQQEFTPCRLCSPVFYDSEGERLHG